jgi:SAM-dependent methyltransferase
MSEEQTADLYRSDKYIGHNPSLHEEDSPWKITKILPLVDQFITLRAPKEINLLDVGGGAGLILKAVGDHLGTRHHKRVNKYAVDLSPGMLDVQRKNNPDITQTLNEDVRHMSLSDKHIDLAMMIDVLEHVPNPEEALEEARRVSHFLILKVPLENSLFLRIWNLIHGGEPRRRNARLIGHINHYNYRQLRSQIEKHAGQVVDHYYTNAFQYSAQWDRVPLRHRIQNAVGGTLFRLSPTMTSLLFFDYVMVLVKCAHQSEHV